MQNEKTESVECRKEQAQMPIIGLGFSAKVARKVCMLLVERIESLGNRVAEQAKQFTLFYRVSQEQFLSTTFYCLSTYSPLPN